MNACQPTFDHAMVTDPNATFRPMIPGQPVAVLLLIENSEAMAKSNRWHDLRDRVLPSLLGKLRIANQGVPIQVLVLPSLPVTDGSATPRADREFYELPDVIFNYHENNFISIGRIRLGINTLVSTFPGLPASRQLFIVAASRPCGDVEAIPPSYMVHESLSNWRKLGIELAQSNIHCHLVLDPSHDVLAFEEVFRTTLSMQKREVVVPHFDEGERKYLVRISGTPAVSTGDFRQIAPHSHAAVGSDPFLLPRTESYPSDLNILGERYAAADAQPGTSQPTSNLVTRLQQIHGMTKKKIYGAKPLRQPFFKDGPGHERTTLAIPLDPPPPIPSSSGTAASPTRDPRRSKARSRSLSNKGLPSETQSRARRQGRRNSRVSSPEPPPVAVRRQSASSSLLPNLSMSVHQGYDPTSAILPSPTSQTYPGYIEQSGSGPTGGYSTSSSALLPNTDLAQPWNEGLYQSELNSAIMPSETSGLSAHACCVPKMPANLPINYSSPPPMTSKQVTTNTSNNQSQQKTFPPLRFSSASSRHSMDAGEAPFLFSLEAEAAAAAQLQEAGLQPSPAADCLRFPDLPPLDSFPPELGRQSVPGQHIPWSLSSPSTLSSGPSSSSSLPSPSASEVPHLSSSRLAFASPFSPTQANISPMNRTTSPSPTFGSSLTGWAG